MKPVNQTKGFTITLEGRKVPKFAIYGNVNNVPYIWRNDLESLQVYKKGKWIRADLTKFPAIAGYIRKFIVSGSFEDKATVVFDKRAAVDAKIQKRLMHEANVGVSRTSTGSPVAKTNNKAIIRYNGSCYSQSAIDGKFYGIDWNDSKEGSLTREDKKYGWNAHAVTFHPDERAADVARHGKITEDPNVRVVKRDGMYVHDVQKCRDDKKETKKVSGEIHSRKVDIFEHGAEYAVANYELTPKEAIQALVMGGLSREMGIKAYRQAH